MSFKCHCCSGECKKSGRYQNRNRTVQRYFCVRCGKSFSEEQPLDGLRIDHEKVVLICKLLVEGIGIRGASRLAGVHSHTVLSVLEQVGQKLQLFHDKTVRQIQTGSLQIDEVWARVGISQKRTDRYDYERGDQYTYLAITAREKLIVSYHTGKRDGDNTETFVADFAERIAGHIQITSDSWRPYPYLVRKYLLGRLDYATMHKEYNLPKQYKDSARVYSPPVCTGVKVRVIAGAPRKDRINTAFVERANLSVRHFNKRFTRLGLGWSRKFSNHKYALCLFVCAHNWCKVHSTLGCTPAVGAKLTNEAWTIEKLIEEATKC